MASSKLERFKTLKSMSECITTPKYIFKVFNEGEGEDLENSQGEIQHDNQALLFKTLEKGFHVYITLT